MGPQQRALRHCCRPSARRAALVTPRASAEVEVTVEEDTVRGCATCFH
jgi:hypothetical protein